MNLVLLRHGESEWNKKNRFTGWTDVGLTRAGGEEAKRAGRLLLANGFDFDICYTSYLKRAIHTLDLVLEQMDRAWLPVVKTWKLNERHYGALQGLNKAKTAEKYGEGQVRIWRRSFSGRPPALAGDDQRNPALLAPYRGVDMAELPLSESLEDTVARVLPYFMTVIGEELRRGRRVLVVAHGNSLRSLVKTLDELSEKDIMKVNIPTGIPLVYTLDDQLRAVRKSYLGDPALVRDKIRDVVRQGKALSFR